MDYSWIDTVIGAGIAYLAYRTGTRRERRRKPGEKKPICGCGHNRSFHEGGKKCRIKLGIDKLENCGCRQYVGPIPYDEFIA